MEDQVNMDVKMEEENSMPHEQSQAQPILQETDWHSREASLLQAFEQQQERLMATFKQELNKHLPLPNNVGPTHDGAPRQNPHILGLSQLRPSSAYQQSLDKNVVDTLLAKNNELQQHIKTLQTMNDKLHQEKSFWKSRSDSNKRKLLQERQRSAELEIKTQELRAVLIPVSETQLSDGEVVSKFISLRSQILKLVKRTWRRDKFKPNIELTQDHVNILGPFMDDRVDMRYVDNHMRGIVFKTLHARILGKRTYALGGSHTRVEDLLGEFEGWVWEQLPTDHARSIIDWRTATMKVTAGLHEDKYQNARALARELWDLFKIFEFRSENSAVEGERLLEKICNDAVDLSLMMRNAKDEYLVESDSGVKGKPISRCEDFAEEEAPEPARSHHPGTIAFYTHGVLAKLPNGNVGDKKILEKAQAVVYC